MVRMAHPTDMAIPECHDFATHQSFPKYNFAKRQETTACSSRLKSCPSAFTFFLKWMWCYRRQVPDFTVVLEYRPVGRELAAVRRVEDAHARPALLVAVSRCDELLGIDEAAEVRRRQPGIIGAGNRIDNPVEQVFFELVKVPAFQQLHDGVQVLVGSNDIPGAVIPAGLGDLFGAEAEQEEVFVADLFPDLDIGAIQCADGQSAVHHELHVAGAGGLLAGSGYLLGQICSRTDDFHRRHAVVRQKHHFEQIAHVGVSVDDLGDVVDQLDDQSWPWRNPAPPCHQSERSAASSCRYRHA